MAKRKRPSFSRSLLGLPVFRRRLGRLVRQPIFIFVTLWGHIAIFSGTAGFYYFEHGSNPRVHSLLDTFYWAIATVTTVGYGDTAPVTKGGKLVSIAMMIVGSLFLWSYTALFAGALVAPELRLVEEEVHEIEQDVQSISDQVRMDENTAAALLHELRLLREDLKKRL